MVQWITFFLKPVPLDLKGCFSCTFFSLLNALQDLTKRATLNFRHKVAQECKRRSATSLLPGWAGEVGTALPSGGPWVKATPGHACSEKCGGTLLPPRLVNQNSNPRSLKSRPNPAAQRLSLTRKCSAASAGTRLSQGARARAPAELPPAAGFSRRRAGSRRPPTWPRRTRRWRCWCRGW